ncbi:hypothetical protein J0H58_35250 [bacterium]|nr:hypothetical protein [bacterium]
MSRRRPLALAAVPVALASAGAAYLYALQPAAAVPADGPVALLLVASRSFSPLPGPAPFPAEVDAFRRAQAALVRSEPVLNAALRTPAARDALKGQAAPIAWLAARVTAEYADPASEVLRVRVADLPPREAAAVANAVAAATLDEYHAHNRAAQSLRRKDVENARDEVRQKLGKRRAAVAETARAAGLPATADEYRAAVAALYQEQAGLRVATAGAEGVRARACENALADVEARIRRAEEEGPRLDAARAEIGALVAAEATLGAELVRIDFEMNSRPRVQFLKPSTAEPR